MTSYVLRRLVQTVVVLFVLSFVTYGLMGLMPGDPLDVACAANPRCSPETLDQMKHAMGLDRPVYERYGIWLGSVVRGDLGYSRTYQQPVMKILGPRLANTLILGACVLLASLVIAIPIGVLAGLKPNSAFDYGVNLAVFAGVSAPSFWLGLMLIIVFSVKLGWFPAGGVETIGAASSGLLASALDRGRHLVLPVTALSCLTIASWVRFTRAAMIETMRADFIRTARAKGLPARRVVLRHGLRNALIPVITVVAVSVPRVVSGAVITETVFAYQGVGKLMYDSILGNDYNVAMFSFLLTCSVVLLMNLAADVLYARLDPRIRYR